MIGCEISSGIDAQPFSGQIAADVTRRLFQLLGVGIARENYNSETIHLLLLRVTLVFASGYYGNWHSTHVRSFLFTGQGQRTVMQDQDDQNCFV